MTAPLRNFHYFENTMKQTRITITETVTVTNTADTVGSGDLPVYATPAMAALMEKTAMTAAAELLGEGETTVGSELNIKHLRPSVIGATITATATLTAQEGRKLTFEVEASDDNGPIGSGNHIRYIVNIEKFMAKANGR